MKPTPTLVMLLFLLAANARSQPLNPGTWNIVRIGYVPKADWKLWGETQLRSQAFYNEWQTTLLRGGVVRTLNPQVKVALGLDKHQYEQASEFRVWPQLQWNRQIARFKFEQQVRADFRFLENTFKNRFRYRFGVQLPLIDEKHSKHPLNFQANNEVFVSGQHYGLERNRLQFLLHYQLTPPSTLQIGVFHQYDSIESGRTSDVVVVGLQVDLMGKSVENMD